MLCVDFQGENCYSGNIIAYLAFMRSLFSRIAAGCLGLMVAAALVPGFQVQGDFTKALRVLIVAGVVLGLINFFIRPLLTLITLPFQIITFGLFGIVVSSVIVWLIDVIFSPEIDIVGLKAILLSGLCVWLVGFLLPREKRNKD